MRLRLMLSVYTMKRLLLLIALRFLSVARVSQSVQSRPDRLLANAVRIDGPFYSRVAAEQNTEADQQESASCEGQEGEGSAEAATVTAVRGQQATVVVVDEVEQVTCWRLEQLNRAGIGTFEAETLATEFLVDLHKIVAAKAAGATDAQLIAMFT